MDSNIKIKKILSICILGILCSNEGFKTVKNEFTLKKTVNEHEKEYLKCLRSWHKKMYEYISENIQ